MLEDLIPSRGVLGWFLQTFEIRIIDSVEDHIDLVLVRDNLALT